MGHLPIAEIAQRQKRAEEAVEVGGLYRHYKGGRYKVIGVAINETDEQPLVIYQPIDHEPLTSWARSLEGEDGWLTPVEYEGKIVDRFTKIEE